MDYSPWSAKNLNNQNRLEKFMQVGIDVTCIHTDFGGHGLSGFGDTATFKIGQISLLDHVLQYSPWSAKNLINQNRLKKFMQVGIDVTYIHTNFGGCDLYDFRRYCYFQKWPNFPFGPWTTVHGQQKI